MLSIHNLFLPCSGCCNCCFFSSFVSFFCSPLLCFKILNAFFFSKFCLNTKIIAHVQIFFKKKTMPYLCNSTIVILLLSPPHLAVILLVDLKVWIFKRMLSIKSANSLKIRRNIFVCTFCSWSAYLMSTNGLDSLEAGPKVISRL